MKFSILELMATFLVTFGFTHAFKLTTSRQFTNKAVQMVNLTLSKFKYFLYIYFLNNDICPIGIKFL